MSLGGEGGWRPVAGEHADTCRDVMTGIGRAIVAGETCGGSACASGALGRDFALLILACAAVDIAKPEKAALRLAA